MKTRDRDLQYVEKHQEIVNYTYGNRRRTQSWSLSPAGSLKALMTAILVSYQSTVLALNSYRIHKYVYSPNISKKQYSELRSLLCAQPYHQDARSRNSYIPLEPYRCSNPIYASDVLTQLCLSAVNCQLDLDLRSGRPWSAGSLVIPSFLPSNFDSSPQPRLRQFKTILTWFTFSAKHICQGVVALVKELAVAICSLVLSPCLLYPWLFIQRHRHLLTSFRCICSWKLLLNAQAKGSSETLGMVGHLCKCCKADTSD